MSCCKCMKGRSAAAKWKDSGGSQMETETHQCEEKCLKFSHSLCTSKIPPHLSKSLENLKHWKTIFRKINKKASPQVEVFIETEYRELFKGFFPLEIQICCKII